MSPAGPPYTRIATSLRGKIESGEYPPGSRLPPHRELARAYEAAQETIRRAIAQLQAEGLVETRGQHGTFVQTRPSIRRIATDFYQRRPTTSTEPTPPFARSVEASGGHASWDHDTTRETADENIATRLAIQPGDPVVVTRYLYRYDGTPIQTAISWEPATLTARTLIELPEAGTTVGVVARFDTIGLHIDSVSEEITARPPSPTEVQTLALPPGVAVLTMRRTYYAGETPVETADIIMAGHRNLLTYRLAVN
ncbi:GntR family transcriptional regulator [Frankia sp. CNm7]|uniref:GntR family transcriptional regulator n=1 Tax=Frankia nepalensis TaxID=1836974 RepID=A0A937RM06_9ACTN|nr:GntR family transcriptional regulator [Frankia nepalensis]MBL7499778.1 GntR family transcriptional regulator [Frankia nepalensis]MBL7512263.1 GntR family transcriptional regulator [Frankia nepalensis]MBL7520452.1 GntR family transcriptional regulator [Frankia nepalensis]MBL7632587.1 GntR family transcriptional regulator [Frankia nepalensis]